MNVYIVLFLFHNVIYVFLLLRLYMFVLFYVLLVFVVLCIVCVYMCTVLLPPGGYPIAVNKYIIIVLYNFVFCNVYVQIT
jgi:hypothetical protein